MKRLNKILSRFQQTMEDLQYHAEVVSSEIGQHDEQISRLTENRTALADERAKALGVAQKIGAMIA